MLSFFVTTPTVMAVFLYIFPFEKARKLTAIAVQAALTCFSSYLFFQSKQGDIVSVVGNFHSVMGITLTADTFSSVFLILSSFLFLIVALYTFNGTASPLFLLFMFIWQAMLNSIFLTRDLFNLFVSIEIKTVIAAVLIMYYRDNRSVYDGMLYLMINTVAILFFLFGVGYIYKLTGVLDMNAAALAIRHMDKSSLLLPYALIMMPISLKCALVPLFSWLPKAHGTPGAPTVVSAILSGFHVKAGVYLFIRFQALFEGIDGSGFFLAIGVVTGIAGFVMALAQSDIKLILAYHTISQIGMIMIGLNLGDAYSHIGSVYHMFNHALFKSALFLCAGIISQVYKTRNIYEIRGVFRQMPLAGIATIMAVMGITGTPLFNGSVSKYFIVSGAGWAVTTAVFLINLGTIISFIKYSSMLFGRPLPQSNSIKPDGYRQAAALILGATCFAGGIFGEEFIKFLFDVNVGVDAAGYLQKTFLFAGSVIAGFLIFKFYVKKSKLLARAKGFEIGFKGICILMGVFFAVILLAGGMF